MFNPLSIPSPSHGEIQLGPIPLRGYALMIIAGIAVAIWLGNKRWIKRGGLAGQVSEVAMWAVPFGVVGGRLYHVLTDWSAYFGPTGRGLSATFKIWQGGLGIWGAIALGAVGAYIGCARAGIKLSGFADAIAPGIVFAQAIGRWGNWFNQELFGRPTSLPWGLQIDRVNRPLDYINYPTFHPTFLYESLACVAIGFLLLWADRKFVFGHGRLFALYLALYCASRGVIETMRVDEAIHIAGIRLNVFTALLVGVGALIYFVRSAENYPGQEIIEEGRVVGFRTFDEVRELRAETQKAAQEAAEAKAEALAEARVQADASTQADFASPNDSGSDGSGSDKSGAIDSTTGLETKPVAKPVLPRSESAPKRGRRIAPKEK